MSATAKKQKPLKRHPSKLKRMSAYMILAIILISIMRGHQLHHPGVVAQ